MKKVYSLFAALLVLMVTCTRLQAQQVIGSNKMPENYSVLKLVANYKTGIYGGLRLPQMTPRSVAPSATR